MTFLYWKLQNWTQHFRWGLTRLEGRDQPPEPSGQAAFDADQDGAGFLGCTLPAQCTVFHLPAFQNTCLQGCFLQGPADSSDLQSL